MPNVRQAILSKVLHAYPLFSGCGAIANSAHLRRVAGATEGDSWATLRDGSRVFVPLDDFDGRTVYYLGDLDRKLTRILSAVVRPGDTAVDIGANLGVMTSHLSTLAGPGGRVHAFEPNPRLHPYLDETLAANRFANVTLHKFALGEAESVLELAFPKDHSGLGSLTRRGYAYRDAQVASVPVKALSDVLAGEGVGKLRLVKIDVEGYEANVLRGARRAFEANPPDAVLMEFQDDGTTADDHPSILPLKQLGYHLFKVPRRYLKVRLLPFEAPGETGNDVLAAHPGGGVEAHLRGLGLLE